MSTFARFAAFIALIAGLGGLIAIVAAGPGYQMEWWDLGFAFFTLMQYGIYAAMAAAGIGLLAFLILLFSRPKTGLVTSLFAAVIGLGLLAVMMPQLTAAQNVPPIHDITTDTENPPEFQAVLPLRQEDGASNPAEYQGDKIVKARSGEAKTVREWQEEGYPDIETLTFRESPEEIFDRAIIVAGADMGMTIHGADKDAGRIEASETSFWFGFTDDVVIRIVEGPGGGTVLDIRSKSRVGQSDIGANAERIRTFSEKMQAL